jgi:hypothetical protein
MLRARSKTITAVKEGQRRARGREIDRGKERGVKRSREREREERMESQDMLKVWQKNKRKPSKSIGWTRTMLLLPECKGLHLWSLMRLLLVLEDEPIGALNAAAIPAAAP